MSAPPLHSAMLRFVHEMAVAGVYTTDTTLVIRSWNAWLEKATGRSEESVVGHSLFEVFPEIIGRGLDRYYTAALRGEVSILAHRFHGHLVRIAGPMGDMPQSARVAPLIDADAIVGTVTVLDDVSERVNSEGELRRQIAAAEQARAIAEEALRVKDEFLATLSHELRTPLNAVLGWTNILLGQSVEPAMLDRALRVIDRNAVAQARLIDDMLDMARIVSGKLRLQMGPVDLVAATLAAIDVVAPGAHAKNLVIQKALGTTPRLITADADRVQQIAWNVLSNAVKFTPTGGTITVRIEEAATGVQLMISDTGKGISPDFLPHVFERFRQANSTVSRTEGGLGLGLALVRQLVEMHGGHIAATSEGANRGSTFTITFPAVVAESAAAAPARTHRADEGVLDGYRVLVVDDEEDWRDLLQTALRTRGADVAVATTAHDALAMVAQGGPERPDVIIADIGLPNEDGYALIHQIRALPGALGRIPVVAITAYAGDDTEKLAIRYGFDAYRSKPIATGAVAVVIADLLRSRRMPRRLPRGVVATPALPSESPNV
jgi:PAS domain S-box-containing protein